MTDKLSFIAEIKNVTSRKTVSNDIEYRLTVVSGDPTLNALGLLSAETLIKLSVEVVNGFDDMPPPILKDVNNE